MISTIDDLLPHIPRSGWRVEPIGFIRRGGLIRRYACPVTAAAKALTGLRFSTGDYGDAARASGIDIELAMEVMKAADDMYFSSKVIRQRLLTHFGLKDRPTA